MGFSAPPAVLAAAAGVSETATTGGTELRKGGGGAFCSGGRIAGVESELGAALGDGAGIDEPTTGVAVASAGSSSGGAEDAGRTGAARPINVCESGAGRALGARSRAAASDTPEATAGPAATAASDAAARSGGEMPINVCERRGNARTGAAGGGAEPGGVTAAGAGATERSAANGGASCSAPQSVSMSSVEGGLEGSERGGSLAGRGGTEEAWP